MSKGTSALVGWLALASLAVVLVGGVLAWLLNPDPTPGEPKGLPGALWQSVLHALDPGALGGDTGHWWYIAMGFAITIGGILIVTAFIGVLTTGLDAKLTELRKGRSEVLERNHTVVLGWSDQVFTVLSELAEANENQRRSCVAILADRDKIDMEDEIRAKVGSTGRMRVACRTGDPVDPDDITIVNPQQAKAIIVLPSTDANPDAQLVRTLLAVTKAREGTQPCPVVGCVNDPKNLAAARLAGGPSAYLVDANDIAARLIVQTCRQSGLSVVYTDLLDFGGDEIYLKEEPALAGYTYGDALHAYRTSSIIGLLAPDGRIALNPPSDTRIQPGIRLIAISEDDDTVVLSGTGPAPVNRDAITAIPSSPPTKERTLILGWNSRARGVITQLDQYVSSGSEAYVVADHDEAAPAIQRLVEEVGNLFLDVKQEDSSDRTVLESLSVPGFDHIIVLCGDDVEPQQADSRTLATLLQLRDMEQKLNDRFSIVSEMADDRNRALAQVTQADDFIVSDKLLTLMMIQVSENPHLASLFANLFDAAGAEIYLKPAGRYVRPGVPINYQTIVEAARVKGESAIGYRVAAEAHQPPTYGIALNPDKAAPLTIRPGDSVIVLAED
jgi:voltage-gated potassium channel Kch